MIDLFGKDVVFSDETEKSVTVSVYTNEMSAAHFAPDVTVLEPKNLRENVKNSWYRRWKNINNGRNCKK